MKRGIIVLGILFLTITITACVPQNADSPDDVAAVTRYVRSGTEGVRLEFTQNLPPRQIYDTADLVALLEVRNVGSNDLDSNDCFINLGGFDRSILRGINERQSCGDLDGKDIYNTEGGFDTIEFKSTNMILPRDVDRYRPSLVATVWYL